MAEDEDQAEAYLGKALAVGFSYFTPLGFFVAAASHPIIALSLGWGELWRNLCNRNSHLPCSLLCRSTFFRFILCALPLRSSQAATGEIAFN